MGGSRRLDRRDHREPEGCTCAKPEQKLAPGWVHTTSGFRRLVEQPGPVELGHREPDRLGVDRHLKRAAKGSDHLRDARMAIAETPDRRRRAVQAMSLVRLKVVDDRFVLDL